MLFETVENNRNRILRFGKPEGSILSEPSAVRGAVGHRLNFSSGQVMSGQRIDEEPQKPRRLGQQLLDLIARK
jgi:hypothetical protein